jgi:hypothetical protein
MRFLLKIRRVVVYYLQDGETWGTLQTGEWSDREWEILAEYEFHKDMHRCA